ncbi:hypothetical protein GJU41_22580 [Bacillus idriensis]|uniref:Replication-relaxation n=1 Tax=Metabacillus idriensis TaxID=324768 RepID=A0A6I2MLJ4_9BACI|nr:replication-relaxation family protein [Metabacillus idriensis]MRX56733.1 hypothetical protein [Metabacillus idriensis]
MKKRDLAILKDLQRFRCMSRDDIIDLHFSGLKKPVTSCNTVLKRLRRDGQIEVNATRQPFMYFSSPASIKKDSAKIPHFLKIVEFYKSLLPHEQPKSYIVEPKYGKGYMEPDVFMRWKRTPWFVEIQRSVYSEKVMLEKYSRYLSYFMSNDWQKEPWQPEKKIFPKIMIVTDTRYKLPPHEQMKFIQVQNISEFIEKTTPKQKEIPSNMKGITVKIG